MSELAARLEDDLRQGRIESIRAIARKAQVSEITIRRILKGDAVRETTLIKLADNYFQEMSRFEVFRMAGILTPEEAFAGQLHDFLFKELARVMGRLSPENLKRVIEYAQRLIDDQSCEDD